MFPVWADNADACSIQYAGTGALKTDFTRFVVFQTFSKSKNVGYFRNISF